MSHVLHRLTHVLGEDLGVEIKCRGHRHCILRDIVGHTRYRSVHAFRPDSHRTHLLRRKTQAFLVGKQSSAIGVKFFFVEGELLSHPNCKGCDLLYPLRQITESFIDTETCVAEAIQVLRDIDDCRRSGRRKLAPCLARGTKFFTKIFIGLGQFIATAARRGHVDEGLQNIEGDGDDRLGDVEETLSNALKNAKAAFHQGKGVFESLCESAQRCCCYGDTADEVLL